jgi:FkbM family methyltransferase
LNLVLHTFGRLVSPLFGTGVGRIPMVIPAYKWVWRHYGQRGVICASVNGFKVFINCDDWAVAPSIYLGHKWEPEETNVVLQNIQPGSTFLDIGAHVGYYSLLASKTVKTVHAFEPSPETFKLLEKNLWVNHIQNVETHNYAVSDQAGTMNLFLDNLSPASNSLFGTGDRKVEVKVCRIDDVIDHADFVKMDVEGGECKALDGMSRLVRGNPKLQMLTEVYPEGLKRAGSSEREYVRMLRADFRLFMMDGTEAGEEDVVRATRKAGSINLYCRRSDV